MKPSSGEYEEKARAGFVLFAIHTFDSAASRLSLREAGWLLWATAVSFVQRNLAPAIKEKQVVSPLSSVGKFNPTQSKYSKP